MSAMRMEALLAVTTQLAAARTREDVGRAGLAGVDAVGASYGGLWVVDRAAGVLRLLAVGTLPRGSIAGWHAVPLDMDAPLPHAVAAGTPIYLHTIAEYRARFPASFARITELISSDDAAYANLPLAGEHEVVGAMAATFEHSADLDDQVKTFLAILSRQCGLALERIALLQAAEEATRAREEILSVVSHDLRNPLGTILMGASTLLHAPGGPKPERVQVVAQRIMRQSERMSRLIDDLVDFASIQAGRLAIHRDHHEASAILASVREIFGPIADERELALVLEPPATPTHLECDAERVVQILANLAANALKVTPRGGTITIGARRDDRGTVFYVRDTGPGIDPDEVPLLFERFWRSKKSAYKGAGLGLSIARGIVEAHGGTIWAESVLGDGATFSFRL